MFFASEVLFIWFRSQYNTHESQKSEESTFKLDNQVGRALVATDFQ